MSASIFVELRRVSECTSEVSIRGHKVLVDRPHEKGGEDAGPMGGELFLASIGGCFMSNLLAAIRARDFTIDQVAASVTGTLEGSPPRFASVEMHVSMPGANRDEAQKLIEIADRGCIMMNTIRGKFDVTVTLDG